MRVPAPANSPAVAVPPASVAPPPAERDPVGVTVTEPAMVLLAMIWPKSRSDVFASDRRGTIVVRIVPVVDWAKAQRGAARVTLAAKAQAVWDQTRFIAQKT